MKWKEGGELQLVTTNQHLFPAINGFTYEAGHFCWLPTDDEFLMPEVKIGPEITTFYSIKFACVYIQIYVWTSSSEWVIDKISEKKNAFFFFFVWSQFNKLGISKIWGARDFVMSRYPLTIQECPGPETYLLAFLFNSQINWFWLKPKRKHQKMRLCRCNWKEQGEWKFF